MVGKNRVALKGFIFIGIPARTNNRAEMNGEGVIAAQWENFYKFDLWKNIQNKKNSSIIALYTDYESDEAGMYTFAIGAEITEASSTVKGMKTIEIPKGKYVIFTTRKGPVQEVVVEAWQEIWEWTQHNERAFSTDFEVYDERAADPENSQVDIYISVK
ncbi:GyrI-like domain-containing protein [Bacillus sp. FJAT-50079]|uniref:GyrI-like domain-containing protein n=1 Tax=Bacillus sp. FJAT-50079 TaxID=2833577 RepID=UPI001BC9C539|nr:GyrI-like domain-containing protein [Bacillus sp. FJAT-50079]MBS4209434.1 AraC family transcriptional regulator [Bacillus sp. FJAT-50079]